MIFGSDNWAGAHPRIAAGMTAHASGYAPAYGTSDIDRTVGDKFNAIFEREVAVFFVGTGTAANSLALASANRPGGVAFCHREAHVIEDECGAPEYFTGGARLLPVDGPRGKMDPARLQTAVDRFSPDNVHGGQPMAVTITQATEAGTVYALDEIETIGAIAKSRGLPFHMDGARFANALVSLGVNAADMTWKRGVDLVSFGGTKNGCWCAEAVILFDLSKAREFGFLRKRAAQLFSKSRFIAAQFDAYFTDDLWLETATHANAMSARLANSMQKSSTVRLAWEPDANEVFAIMARQTMESLKAKGAVFYPWHAPHGYAGRIEPDETVCRFVTSFATTAQEVDRFGELIA